MDVSNLTSLEIVQLIENDSTLTEQEIDSLKNELTVKRNLTYDSIKKYAIEIVEDKAMKAFMLDQLINSEFSLPKSHFLNEEEVREIYIKLLKERMQEKEGFKFDVWLYALGG